MRRFGLIFVTSAYLVLLAFSTQCFAILINTDSLGALKRGQSEYFNTNLDQRLTVQVQLVGGVNSPGIYHIPDNSTLLEAVSLAGGALPNADLSKVHVRRLVGAETQSFNYDLADLVAKPTQPLPKVANRDVILIEAQNTQTTLTLQVVATIIGIISSGLLAYVTVNNISKGK